MANLAAIPAPEPGHVLIVARLEDGGLFTLPVPTETFAMTDWANFPRLVAEGRER